MGGCPFLDKTEISYILDIYDFVSFLSNEDVGVEKF